MKQKFRIYKVVKGGTMRRLNCAFRYVISSKQDTGRSDGLIEYEIKEGNTFAVGDFNSI